MTFIDLEKVVLRNRTLQTLQKYNINNCLIRIIKELYPDNKTYKHIKQGNRLSQLICPSKSLRQDCGLSPLLLNIYLEHLYGISAEGITKL